MSGTHSRGRVTPGRLQDVGGRTAPGASSRAVTEETESRKQKYGAAGNVVPMRTPIVCLDSTF